MIPYTITVDFLICTSYSLHRLPCCQHVCSHIAVYRLPIQYSVSVRTNIENDQFPVLATWNEDHSHWSRPWPLLKNPRSDPGIYAKGCKHVLTTHKNVPSYVFCIPIDHKISRPSVAPFLTLSSRAQHQASSLVPNHSGIFQSKPLGKHSLRHTCSWMHWTYLHDVQPQLKCRTCHLSDIRAGRYCVFYSFLPRKKEDYFICTLYMYVCTGGMYV